MIRESAATGLAGVLLVGAVAWSPLPFGSALPGHHFWLALGLLGAGAAMVLSPAWERLDPRSAAPGLALLGLAGLGLLQAIPMPAPFVGWLAPEALEVWTRSIVVTGASEPHMVTFSFAPRQTLVAATWVGVLGIAFLAAFLVGHDRRARRALAIAITFGAVLQIFASAIPGLAGGEASWWWDSEAPTWSIRFRGTFANVDHMALFLGMALAAVVAAGWWAARRLFGARGTLTQRIAFGAVPPLLFLTLAAGIARTQSRGSLLSVGAGMVVMAGLIAGHYRRRKLLVSGTALAAAGLALVSIWVSCFSGREGMRRLLDTSVYDVTVGERARVAVESLKLWTRVPLTGTGLGAYRQAFPLVQPADVEGGWDHAHNDWVELLVTTGPLGVLLLGAGLWLLVPRLWSVFERGPRSEDRAAGLAALGALAIAAAHEVVDFGLLVPANAVLLVVLCGMAAGVPVHSGREVPERRRGSKSSSRRRSRTAPARGEGRPEEPSEAPGDPAPPADQEASPARSISRIGPGNTRSPATVSKATRWGSESSTTSISSS